MGDFRGHLVRLTDEYKVLAIKALALEECTHRGGPDPHWDPPHFENRLLTDIGDRLGLNKGTICQAEWTPTATVSLVLAVAALVLPLLASESSLTSKLCLGLSSQK